MKLRPSAKMASRSAFRTVTPICRCGAEEPTTPVEPGKPATGDSSTLVLWLALLAVSGMAVTVIPSRKKRSR